MRDYWIRFTFINTYISIGSSMFCHQVMHKSTITLHTNATFQRKECQAHIGKSRVKVCLGLPDPGSAYGTNIKHQNGKGVRTSIALCTLWQMFRFQMKKS